MTTVPGGHLRRLMVVRIKINGDKEINLKKESIFDAVLRNGILVLAPS